MSIKQFFHKDITKRFLFDILIYTYGKIKTKVKNLMALEVQVMIFNIKPLSETRRME